MTTAAQSVARLYIARNRQRREYRATSYQPDLLLTAWATWEDVRDCFAREVADDVVKGYEHSLKDDVERYRLAVERMIRARDLVPRRCQGGARREERVMTSLGTDQ